MNHTTVRKQLSLILLILVLLVPAIHKILGEIPPSWFIDKFSDSIINKLPGGISTSFYLIILLEITGPILLFIGLIQLIRKRPNKRAIQFGFFVCYILFLVLTFGSFLVQDYDNGFKDFMYFIGIMLIERFYFSYGE